MTEGVAGMRVLLDERLGAVMRFLQKSLTGRSKRRKLSFTMRLERLAVNADRTL